MKSMLAGLGAAALISSGLVAAATTTAEAAPYPGTVATNCSVNVLESSAREGTRIAVRVTAPGEGDPKGRVRVSVERRNGGDSASDSGWFDGGRTILNLGRLRPGVYDGDMFFNSMPPRSVYKNCGEGFSFRVTRR